MFASLFFTVLNFTKILQKTRLYKIMHLYIKACDSSVLDSGIGVWISSLHHLMLNPTKQWTSEYPLLTWGLIYTGGG